MTNTMSRSKCPLGHGYYEHEGPCHWECAKCHNAIGPEDDNDGLCITCHTDVVTERLIDAAVSRHGENIVPAGIARTLADSVVDHGKYGGLTLFYNTPDKSTRIINERTLEKHFSAGVWIE